jgi:hypothetical protein
MNKSKSKRPPARISPLPKDHPNLRLSIDKMVFCHNCPIARAGSKCDTVDNCHYRVLIGLAGLPKAKSASRQAHRNISMIEICKRGGYNINSFVD